MIDLLKASVGMFRQSLVRMPLVWIALLLATTATNVTDLVVAHPQPHHFPPLLLASLAVRLLGVTWISSAALRIFVLSPAKPWGLDRGFALYLLLGLTLMVLVLAVIIGWKALLPLTGLSGFAAKLWIATGPLLATVLAALVQFRVLTWFIGVSVRMPQTSFLRAWLQMRSVTGPAFVVFLILVLPLSALHLGVTAGVLLASMSDTAKLVWTIADGIETTVMEMLLLALMGAAYRRATALPVAC